MFKIDRTSVRYMDEHISLLAVQDARGERGEADPPPSEEGVDCPAPPSPQILMEQARQRAREMLEQARLEGEALCRRGYEEGFQEGLEAARTQNRQESELREALGQQICHYQDRLGKHAGEAVRRLSLEIAQKVILRKLEQDDTLFLEILQGALPRLEGKEKVTLRVSAEDYQRFFRRAGAADSDHGLAPHVTVVGDAHLCVGSCVFETEDGIMDASVNVQIQRIGRALEGDSEAV